MRSSSSTPPSNRPRKSVRFAEDSNVTHVEYELYSAQDQWVSGVEFEEAKKQAKRRIQEWRMVNYGVLLRDVFDNPHPNVQEKINAFALLDEKDCVRGLERQLSSRLDHQISTIKRRATRTVLSHQKLMRKDRVKPEHIEEELAVIARMHSRPHVQFARRKGKADALAAEDEDVTPARSLVDQMTIMNEKLRPKGGNLSLAASSRTPLATSPRKSSREARVA